MLYEKKSFETRLKDVFWFCKICSCDNSRRHFNFHLLFLSCRFLTSVHVRRTQCFHPLSFTGVKSTTSAAKVMFFHWELVCCLLRVSGGFMLSNRSLQQQFGTSVQFNKKNLKKKLYLSPRGNFRGRKSRKNIQRRHQRHAWKAFFLFNHLHLASNQHCSAEQEVHRDQSLIVISVCKIFFEAIIIRQEHKKGERKEEENSWRQQQDK